MPPPRQPSGVNPVRRPARLRAAQVLLGCAGALLALAACQPRGDVSQETGDGRYPVTGTVIAVDADRGTLLVDHDEIPGYMPAMTMEFIVSPGDLAVAREGMAIRATIHRGTEGYYLEEMWPAGVSNDRVVGGAAVALRNDTVTRGRNAFREVGESLPSFALFDQAGEIVQPARFRGRQIVLNFIFTRCPDADMCPASTARMKEVQEKAREAGIANLQLISITLDPEYDTPGVLRDYAEVNGIDTANFSFLTGPEGAIKDLMAQLGILAFRDGPLLRHTLTTLLVDEEGRLLHRETGSAWSPADFVARLRRPAATP